MKFLRKSLINATLAFSFSASLMLPMLTSPAMAAEKCQPQNLPFKANLKTNV
ncbi:MAG: hypothetical protein HOP06_08215 [Methylotenera sp.]|nr:hypothetical protein [Methylotenera sp.]